MKMEKKETNVDAASIKSAHGDLESIAFVSDEIGDGNTTVGEDDGVGGLRVPSEFLFLATKGEAWSSLLDQNA